VAAAGARFVPPVPAGLSVPRRARLAADWNQSTIQRGELTRFSIPRNGVNAPSHYSESGRGFGLRRKKNSRATSLLKRLCFPLTVLSWCRNASLRFSNAWNHFSQEMGFIVSRPPYPGKSMQSTPLACARRSIPLAVAGRPPRSATHRWISPGSVVISTEPGPRRDGFGVARRAPALRRARGVILRCREIAPARDWDGKGMMDRGFIPLLFGILRNRIDSSILRPVWGMAVWSRPISRRLREKKELEYRSGETEDV
jgi:hypothetical protein